MAEALLFMVGASGVGKTAILQRLSEDPGFAGTCHFFDEVGVPSEADMLRLHGSPEEWQENVTRRWVKQLAAHPGSIAVLEGSTRPTYVIKACEFVGVAHYRIILLDCPSDIRRHRLGEFRDQPELATPDMDAWAAYLRGQADALGIAVIDTSRLSVDDLAAGIRIHAERFLEEIRSEPLKA